MKTIRIILLFALVAATSCTREQLIGEDAPVTGEQEVEIFFGQVGDTRGAIVEEDNVSALDLLVFKADKFLYRRSAYRVDAKYRATLTIDSGLDVYFVANAREILDAAAGDLVADMSWEEVRQELIDENPSRLVFTAAAEIKLPMWGLLKNKDVEDIPMIHWGAVNMLRSVASVDVTVSTEVLDATFLLQEVRLYFVPDKGFLAPAAANYDETEIAVKAAASPADMKTTVTLTSNLYDAATKSIANKLYLYDNDTDESNRTLLPNTTRRHTRVVIGGTYKGTKYYWPVDFETENDELDQVTRNWKYILQINSVTSAGYTDPETASTEPAVGLNVSIVKWNEKLEADFHVSGPYYVGITYDPYWQREVILDRPAGSTRLVGLRSNIKGDQIQLEFAAGGSNGDTQEIAGGIENERFRVEKIVDSNGYITGLLFTALADYSTSDDDTNRDTLVVTSGRIQFEIPITQVSSGPNDWEDGGEKETDVE